MKSGLVISGKHEATQQRYGKILDSLIASGSTDSYIVVPDWETHSITDYVNQICKKLEIQTAPRTVIGFSMGALIALLASGQCEVENLILCSPSGYFREYAPILEKDDLKYARTNFADFESFSAFDAITNANVKNGYILAGENELKEWGDFRKWIEDLRRLSSWKYFEISNTGHEIEAIAYQNVVKGIINDLI